MLRIIRRPFLLFLCGGVSLLLALPVFGQGTPIDSPPSASSADPAPPARSSVIQAPEQAPRPDTDAYRIRAGDELVIDLVGEEWGGTFKVPKNGNLNFRFIGTLNVLDLTRSQLESEIRSRLQPDYYRNPELRINFKTFAPLEVLVMGAVGQPKKVQLPQGAGVMEAILDAGALTKNSQRARMFIFRNQNGDTSVYYSNYEQYVKGDFQQDVPLMEGDLVYVHTNFWPHFDTLDELLRTLGFSTTISREIRSLAD